MDDWAMLELGKLPAIMLYCMCVMVEVGILS